MIKSEIFPHDLSSLAPCEGIVKFRLNLFVYFIIRKKNDITEQYRVSYIKDPMLNLNNFSDISCDRHSGRCPKLKGEALWSCTIYAPAAIPVIW